MNQDDYIALMYKKLKSDISKKELDLVDRYILSDVGHAQLFEEIRQSWNEETSNLSIDTRSEFKRLQSRISGSKKQEGKVRFLNWKRLSLAAGFILLAGIFIWQQNQTITYKEFAAINTAKEVTLKDGSIVWINEGSKISVPSNYGEDDRAIRLDGEAYFDVQKNDALVFKIDAKEIEVTVLGTAFNVKESDNNVQVMVDRGKVKVKETIGNEEQILEANQSALYNKELKEFSDHPIFNTNAMYWKTGRLRFSQQTFGSAIKEIGEIFNTGIVVENSALAECEISGSFSGRDLNTILTSISTQFNAKLIQNDNVILILDGICQ